MKGKNLKEVFGEVLQIADKNSPAILTGLTVAGVIATAVMAWKQAPKATEVVAQHKLNKESIPEDDKEARAEETVEFTKAMAPIVLPPVIMGAATIACAVGANTVSSKRIAALSAAYSIAETSLKDYAAKSVEVLGEKKDKLVKNAIAEEKVKNDPPVPGKQIIMTGNGDVLCYDVISGRYFKSNAETIRQKVNDINERLMDEYYISLNEFYYELGLPDIKIGSELGFCMEGSGHGKLVVDFSTTLSEENVPVLVLNYDVNPKYGKGLYG